MKQAKGKNKKNKMTEEKEKTPITKREWILVIAVIVLVIVLFIKSLFFDAYVPQTPDEQIVYDEFEQIVSQEHDSALYQSHFLSTRIIAVREENQIIKGRYRKYILGVIPIGDEFYSSDKVE